MITRQSFVMSRQHLPSQQHQVPTGCWISSKQSKSNLLSGCIRQILIACKSVMGAAMGERVKLGALSLLLSMLLTAVTLGPLLYFMR